MDKSRKIYSYITICCFVLTSILINFNILTVTTMILAGIILSVLESRIFFNLHKKALEHIILIIVMLPINIFISYRVFLSKDYNVGLEYILFFGIMFLSLLVFAIKDFVKTKASIRRTRYNSDFKEYVKLFIVIIFVLDIFTPMIVKQLKCTELKLESIKMDYINGWRHYGKDKYDGIRDEIEYKIKSLERVKRSNAIEQLNIIKETVREGKKNYKINCSIWSDPGEIIFLNNNKVYLKIRGEITFLNGMIGTKDDYYILNLSDQSKQEIEKFFCGVTIN